MLDQTNLVQQTYNYLKERILQKDYYPGERIHYEGICAELGISKTPMREAITLLQQDGIVEVKPRLGTFITKPKAKNIKDVFNLRRAIECLALDLSFNNIPKSEIEILLADAERLSSHKLENYQEYIDHDNTFHATFIKYADNDYVEKVMKSIEVQIQWFSILTSKSIERLFLANQKHKEILLLIYENKKEESMALLNDHIEIAKKLMLEDFGEED